MDEKTAWKNFTESGRIADYLEYKKVLEMKSGDRCESVNKRVDSKG